MKHRLLTIAALTLATAGSLTSVEPAFAAGKEKCYGVAKAGHNDCANLAGTHSCAAQSTVDFDIGEYKIVDAGTCSALGGHSPDEAKKIYEAQQS